LYADYLEYRERATTLSALATDANSALRTDSETGDELDVSYVSANYFAVLGIGPRIGRFFDLSEDSVPGRDAVAVLSHAFWQRRYDGDPQAVGRSLRLSGVDHRIVGIAPPGFEGLKTGWGTDVFLPNMMYVGEADVSTRKNGNFDLIGRLAPGRTVADVQAEMSVLARALESAFPETNRGFSLHVANLRGVLPQEAEQQATIPKLLSIVVACLLAIACANLAGLLLSRNLTRQKELTIRMALGARRGQLVRQLLAECFLLSAAAALGGMLVATWGTALLQIGYAREIVGGARHAYALHLDASAFLVSLSIALLAAVGFGLVPALFASRPDLLPAIAADGTARSPRGTRLRAAFLAGQLALCLVLLVATGLALRSAHTVRRAPGIDARQVAYFNIAPGLADHRDGRAAKFADELRRRLESRPDVEAVSFAWHPPGLWFATGSVALPDQPPLSPEDALTVPLNWVAPAFFDVLKIPVTAGRGVLQRDVDEKRRVAVVNQALAQRLWSEADPVGRTLLVRDKPHSVVGVVRYAGLRASGTLDQPYLFCSDPERVPAGNLVARVRGNAETALPSLRAEIRALDASVPVRTQMTLDDVFANQYADVTLALGVLTFVAGLAALLTGIGLYGAVALAVGQRTREIGIRLALGATVANVLRLVLRDGMKVVAAGIVLGSAGALAGTRILSNLLYGVAATDGPTFAAGVVVLVTVATIACILPARRAARIDPMRALRQE
jgi:predicted permease